MKTNNHKSIFFSKYNRIQIEEMLEKEAANGWMLEKNNFKWHFRKCEPKKLKFSVVYFPKASVYDADKSEAQLIHQDFCEQSGWNFVTGKEYLLVFCSEKADPTPIETDASLEVSAIHKIIKKKLLPLFYIHIFASLMPLISRLSTVMTKPIYLLANNLNIISISLYLLIMILAAGSLLKHFMWYRQAKKQVLITGSFHEPIKTHRIPVVNTILLVIALFFDIAANRFLRNYMIIIAAAAIGLIVAFDYVFITIMKKIKLKPLCIHITVFLITIVQAIMGVYLVGEYGYDFVITRRPPYAYHDHKGWSEYIYRDELPLTVEDLYETDYDDYSYEIESHTSSILLQHTEYKQEPCLDALGEYDLKYSITKIKVPLFYNVCKYSLLKNFAHNYGRPDPEEPGWEQHKQIDASFWNANEAYQLKLGDDMISRYLICYDDCIIEIDFPQNAVIGKKRANVVSEIAK